MRYNLVEEMIVVKCSSSIVSCSDDPLVEELSTIKRARSRSFWFLKCSFTWRITELCYLSFNIATVIQALKECLYSTGIVGSLELLKLFASLHIFLLVRQRYVRGTELNSVMNGPTAYW